MTFFSRSRFFFCFTSTEPELVGIFWIWTKEIHWNYHIFDIINKKLSPVLLTFLKVRCMSLFFWSAITTRWSYRGCWILAKRKRSLTYQQVGKWSSQNLLLLLHPSIHPCNCTQEASATWSPEARLWHRAGRLLRILTIFLRTEPANCSSSHLKERSLQFWQLS